jgi:hypothetical protein
MIYYYVNQGQGINFGFAHLLCNWLRLAEKTNEWKQVYVIKSIKNCRLLFSGIL